LAERFHIHNQEVEPGVFELSLERQEGKRHLLGTRWETVAVLARRRYRAKDMFGLAEYRAACDAVRAGGERLGLVPTMGALHHAHQSLMRVARQHSQRVAVTIFVNPTQFGPNEDFERYPRDLSADLQACSLWTP